MSLLDYSELEARIMNALVVAYEFGQTDGDHHKAWVIDQMVRALHGVDYDQWVENYEGDGEYVWDTGVAP